MERGRREVDEELRAREREIGGRRAGLPDVLADRGADVQLPEAEQDEVAAFGEVAVLVEDAIVRQELLAVHGADLAFRAHRARVREVAVEPGRPDEGDASVRGAGDLLERVARGPHEPGPEKEVLGRVAGDRELREDDEIGAFAPCVGEEREDLLAVAGEVADDRVQLRERDPQGLPFTVTNRVYKAVRPMEVTFERRYRGPLTSANGGFACGSLAAFVDADEVE